MSTNTTDTNTTARNMDNNSSKTSTNYNEIDSRFWIKVSEHIPSVEECYTYCAADASCGAVATFIGITRNNFNGKHVQKLSYEGYVPMAEKEMYKLCMEATTSSSSNSCFPSVKRIAMMHILGDCPVGRASVIIAASSPHRTEAMHCTEFLINELKARIPIWKKEVYVGDDGAVWKENVEWHQGQQRRVMVKQEEQGKEE